MHNTTTGTLRRRAARIALVLLAAAGGSAVAATAAPAIEFRSLGASVNDLSGAPSRQAGAHPDVELKFTLPQTDPANRASALVEQPHQLLLDLPRGLIGNPTAAPTCSENQLKAGPNGNSAVCPVGAQVGYAEIGSAQASFTAGVYNVDPPKGSPALFAFNVLGAVVRLTPTVRAGDYGITIDSGAISQAVPVPSADVTLWGVPADSVHDVDRFADVTGHSGFFFPPAKSQSPRRAFLTAPTSCPGTPEVTTARLDGWLSIGQFTTQSFSSDFDGVPFISTGCDRLPFAPSIDVHATSRIAGAPTGLDVDLAVPQSDAPDGLATAAVRDVSVTLPPGMAVTAGAAAGLGACLPAQIGLGTDAAETCPAASKLGTVEVDTPLLATPLTGAVYLAPQTPDHLVSLYLSASASGVTIKLPGTVDLDPVSGQVTATFRDNPQLPFNLLKLHFFGGPGAALANPPTCGAHTVQAAISSWASDTPVAASASFPVDQGCDRATRFEPALSAGLVDPKAGGSSSFTLTVSRPDGEQDIASLVTSLPPGVLGTVGAVPQCPEAQAATGTCSPASQVGRTTVLAGAGASPLAVPQPGKSPTAVYLAGPYEGAPFSLSIVVPAQAGPFDLGTVVVRAGLLIDPIDAHVTVVSDPLPTILKGVPLRMQQVTVTIDRPGFMRNPTNCAPMAVAADVRSVAGATAQLANRFQVADCARLDLKPTLALTLSGKGQTTDGKHPAVTAKLTQPAGQANLKKVVVKLPLSVALDPDNSVSDDLCSFVAGSKPDPQCPKSSIVGTATAVTPVLDQPLSGPVYFVKNERTDAKTKRQIRTLPKLAIPLVGQNGVKLLLTGTSSVVDDQLVTTFDQIPDAPVSSFTLSINGGKRGILVVSGDKANLCRTSQVAAQQIGGQNGRRADTDLTIRTPSCPLAVVASSHTPSTLKVTVGGIDAGAIGVSGRGLAATSRTIGAATVATLQPRLTQATASRLARGHDVTTRVTVSFRPRGATKARTAHRTLTIHGAAR